MKSNFFYVFIIGFSSIIAGLLNYLYHPLMLKYMTLTEFGEFESLVSIFNILGVLTTGVILFLVKEISKSSKDYSRIKSIFYDSNKILFYCGLFCYILFLALIPLIKRFLHIEHGLLLALCGLTIIFTFQSTVLNAVLQGTKKFNYISIISIVGAVAKLIFGLLFVYLGFKVLGAIIGFIISGLVVMIFSFFYIYKMLISVTKTQVDIKKDFLKERKDIFNYMLLVILLSIFMNFDILIAKNIFDSELVGMYSSLSVIAKFLIFLGASIETVYYPQIMEYEKHNLPLHFIKNSSMMILLMGFLAIGVNYYFGGYFLNIMKDGFSQHINYFILILVFCWFYVFLAYFAKILIGRKQYYINYLLIFFLLLLLIIVYSYGKISLNNYIYSYIGIYFFISLILYIIIYYKTKSV